jgi:hypothetical protein
MIEWIVGRVDTGVKKKLLMDVIVYAKAVGQEVKTFICNRPNRGDPCVRQQGFPDLGTFCSGLRIPNSIFMPWPATSG